MGRKRILRVSHKKNDSDREMTSTDTDLGGVIVLLSAITVVTVLIYSSYTLECKQQHNDDLYDKILKTNPQCMKWLSYIGNYPVWRIATTIGLSIAIIITLAVYVLWRDKTKSASQTACQLGATLLTTAFLTQRAAQMTAHYLIWHIMCRGFGCSTCGVVGGNGFFSEPE
jgi:hypothetical protein